MVAVNLLYDTGARDERPELTGIAHLFEHLMFGGSANVADYSVEIEAAGGSDNAWTSNDFTNFYEVLPAQNVETAFWLESDRMLSPLLDERTLEVQRRVVIEEFKQQCLNRPYGDMAHYLRKMLYGDSHPYGWPVIGKEPGHVASVTAEDARDWFFRHYGPDNAVLAVCGNVTFERVKELAEVVWSDTAPRHSAAPFAGSDFSDG
jgi:predicted Zn-dependent peptidase